MKGEDLQEIVKGYFMPLGFRHGFFLRGFWSTGVEGEISNFEFLNIQPVRRGILADL